jgi:hypothetical protein
MKRNPSTRTLIPDVEQMRTIYRHDAGADIPER